MGAIRASLEKILIRVCLTNEVSKQQARVAEVKRRKFFVCLIIVIDAVKIRHFFFKF